MSRSTSYWHKIPSPPSPTSSSLFTLLFPTLKPLNFILTIGTITTLVRTLKCLRLLTSSLSLQSKNSLNSNDSLRSTILEQRDKEIIRSCTELLSIFVSTSFLILMMVIPFPSIPLLSTLLSYITTVYIIIIYIPRSQISTLAFYSIIVPAVRGLHTTLSEDVGPRIVRKLCEVPSLVFDMFFPGVLYADDYDDDDDDDNDDDVEVEKGDVGKVNEDEDFKFVCISDNEQRIATRPTDDESDESVTSSSFEVLFAHNPPKLNLIHQDTINGQSRSPMSPLVNPTPGLRPLSTPSLDDEINRLPPLGGATPPSKEKTKSKRSTLKARHSKAFERTLTMTSPVAQSRVAGSGLWLREFKSQHINHRLSSVTMQCEKEGFEEKENSIYHSIRNENHESTQSLSSSLNTKKTDSVHNAFPLSPSPVLSPSPLLSTAAPLPPPPPIPTPTPRDKFSFENMKLQSSIQSSRGRSPSPSGRPPSPGGVRRRPPSPARSLGSSRRGRPPSPGPGRLRPQGSGSLRPPSPSHKKIPSVAVRNTGAAVQESVVSSSHHSSKPFRSKTRESFGLSLRTFLTGSDHIRIRDSLFDLDLPPRPSNTSKKLGMARDSNSLQPILRKPLVADDKRNSRVITRSGTRREKTTTKKERIARIPSLSGSSGDQGAVVDQGASAYDRKRENRSTEGRGSGRGKI